MMHGQKNIKLCCVC